MEKAIELQSQSNLLTTKAQKLEKSEVDPKIYEDLHKYAGKLRDQADNYGKKYNEFSLKIDELEARKEVALAIKETSNILAPDEALSILKEAENHIEQLEAEAHAVLKFESMG
jgi:phage shock protein A